MLVLHGHKHYATARLLEGVSRGQGDVLIASAGSAGLAQPWANGTRHDAARLWPSFNVIDWDRDLISIDMVSFAWKGYNTSRHARRALVRARREGSQWRIQHPAEAELEEAGPSLSLNRTRYVLETSRDFNGRWDLQCEREVKADPGCGLSRYVETVDGVDDARCYIDGQQQGLAVPTHVHLELDGVTRYRVTGAVARIMGVLPHRHAQSPFASVSFMNRYRSSRACLELRGLPDAEHKAFASVTDLGTGLERPLRLDRSKQAGSVVAELVDCPARTLLRIYWRLDRRPTL